MDNGKVSTTNPRKLSNSEVLALPTGMYFKDSTGYVREVPGNPTDYRTYRVMRVEDLGIGFPILFHVYRGINGATHWDVVTRG